MRDKQKEKQMIEDLKKAGKYKKPVLSSEAFNKYLDKKKEKFKEGVPKISKKNLSKLKTKVTSKGILKKNDMKIRVDTSYKAPSVLGDENRFFKGELDKEKRSLFFS